MSLLPKQVMTPENLAAHQSNGRRSQGAATPEGLERLRAANLRHGFYSQKADQALVALGEDPAELASLVDSLFDLYAPQNAYHARLVQGLARALWRMERADRIQESQTVLRVEQARHQANEAARRIHDTLEVKLQALQGLAAEATQSDFATQMGHVKLLQKYYGEEPEEGRPGQIWLLLHQLASTAAGRMRLQSMVTEIEAFSTKESRDLCRLELGEFLAEEIAEVEAALADARAELWKYDSPFAHEALMAPQSKSDAFMLRMLDSNFRQVCRLTQILDKLTAAPANSRSSLADFPSKKEQLPIPAPALTPETAPPVKADPPAKAEPSAKAEPPVKADEASENTGDSGEVAENKECQNLAIDSLSLGLDGSSRATPATEEPHTAHPAVCIAIP